MIKIIERLEAPYKSIVTVVKPAAGGDAQSQDNGQQMVRKMVQEASLADQIETQGYHLRLPVTTIDFSKQQSSKTSRGASALGIGARHEIANNEQSEEHKLIR